MFIDRVFREKFGKTYNLFNSFGALNAPDNFRSFHICPLIIFMSYSLFLRYLHYFNGLLLCTNNADWNKFRSNLCNYVIHIVYRIAPIKGLITISTIYYNLEYTYKTSLIYILCDIPSNFILYFITLYVGTCRSMFVLLEKGALKK